MKTKNKLVDRSIAIKEEPKNTLRYVFIKKRHIKGEKHITPMDFAEHLRKSDVSENSKVYYMVDFCKMEFMKGVGSKSRSVCNFQSMKSPVKLNSLLSKFFCYITWFVISPD